jgi:hypothetical protein
MLKTAFILIAALLLWQHSSVLNLLFNIRVLIYEQPLLFLAILLLYLVVGILLSYRNLKVLPLFLSGFLLFGVIFNSFCSYQEVTKFGITQDVFTGLFTILLHSPAAPILLATVDFDVSAVLGLFVLGFMFFKGIVTVRKWFKVPRFEQILLGCAFGFGITSFTTFILAALQLLTVRNVLLTDIAFFSAVFLLPRTIIELPKIDTALSGTEKKLWILISIVLVCGFSYAVLFPPLEWDSLAYQAYYSKLIYENGGLPELFGPSIGIEMSAAYPPAYQMLGCYIYVLSGDSNTQFMNVLSYISGVLSLLAVFLFATQVILSHRMYAVAAAVAVPFFLGFSASPHYLTLLIFFNSLFLVYLTGYVLSGNIHSLWLSAAFLGFACLTSYLALASFLFLVIGYVRKRFPLKILGITGLALPPFLRNFWFTGNPLFPLFGVGRQLQNLLWASNTAHFDTQTVYAGLSLTSPFSILDFLMNRISSVRPLLPLLMVVGVVFLVFVRPKSEKRWLCLCFLASIFIFLVRPTFDRYLLIYIPVYSSFFAWLVYKSEELSFDVLNHSLKVALIVSLSIVVIGIVITGPLMVASHLKQFPEQPLDDWAYVRQFYPHDTPCWRWLNENTPENACVATYDIRYYYIDKKIFPLDGLEAVPLYEMSAEEALDFLKEHYVVYWFSSRWTSPADATCPPAYFENPLVPYLGSDILPLVFLSGQSAVYGVGHQKIDYQEILDTEHTLYPVYGFEYSFERGEMVYFDIPGDLHGSIITLQFSRQVKAALYKGHAASSSLLGELVEEANGTDLILEAYSGKYTLYIESEEPFTVTILI